MPSAGSPVARWPFVLCVMASAAVMAPLLLSSYYVIVLTYALALSVACLGVNLLLGTTGLLSLGHAAYFGIGAYAGGFAYVFLDLKSLELYLVVGVAAATVLAALAAAVCVRTTRIYFTIFTLAIAQIVHALFVSGAVFWPFGGQGKGLFLLGGGGLHIPQLTIAGLELASDEFAVAMYWVTLAGLVVVATVLWRVTHSPFGMALRAIRDNEVRAAFIGVPVRAHRWRAFVISGAITGLAGGLFGQLSRQVTPDQLHWLFSAGLVTATVLGGSQHFWGPVVGAFLVTALQEIAVRFVLHRGLILGSLLIVVVFAFPAGIVGGITALATTLWRVVSGRGSSNA